MLSKKVIKDIQSLRHKKERDTTGLFIAEGPKVVGELLEALPGAAVQVYATDDWSGQAGDYPVETVTAPELQKLSQLQVANNVLAVFRQLPVPKLPTVRDLCLYLDTIQDPGNLGTLIRIADWFGIQQVVCSTGCADLYNPKVVQSTMASLARVPVSYDGEDSWLGRQSVPVIAATLSGESIYTIDLPAAMVLVIGNESRGVRPAFLEQATRQVTIPRIGGAESLNAAVATGILLSHFRAS